MQVEAFDPLRAAASISTVSTRGVCAAAALFHAGHGGQSIVRPPQRLGPGELLLVRLIWLRGREFVGDHAEPVYEAAEPKDFLWGEQDMAFVGIFSSRSRMPCPCCEGTSSAASTVSASMMTPSWLALRVDVSAPKPPQLLLRG